jgi:ATP-dependent Lon protease
VSEAQTTTIEIGGERVEVPVHVPVLPVRNTVVFPGVTLPLSVGRPASLAAVQQAARSGGFLAVVTQRAPDTEQPRLRSVRWPRSSTWPTPARVSRWSRSGWLGFACAT